MYAGAEKDSEGWVIRLFDRNGNQISRIEFRVSYEKAEQMTGDLPVEIVSDLMHEIRRQVMTRENVFLPQPIK